MGPLRRSLPRFLPLLSLACAGCGGGGGGSPAIAQPAPAPTPDFAISLSSSALSLPQGTTTTITVSVAGQNGFAGSVQVTLAGFPRGVLSNPVSSIKGEVKKKHSCDCRSSFC